MAKKTPWCPAEKKAWLSQQQKKRSYQDDVVSVIDSLTDRFDVEQYGELIYEPGNYPLFLIKTRNWDENKQTLLVTGGVHGYETSGVHGALEFLQQKAHKFSTSFNIAVAPCVSPWGYETINRWNPETIDPNRSFSELGESQESSALIKAVASLETQVYAHVDLHETTDTDNTQFRPALEARDGMSMDHWEIPDGFYLVGDSENPADDFQQNIIKSVEKVTHIAQADESNCIIGEPLIQHGVINYPTKKLKLCSSLTGCKYATTTEVYPDSPRANDELCIQAQIAAICGALEYLENKLV